MTVFFDVSISKPNQQTLTCVHGHACGKVFALTLSASCSFECATDGMLLDIMHVGLEGALLLPGQEAGRRRCLQPHA